MRQFYSRLSYSFGNEDWETEHKALKIQPDDRILCVTASGDRPLNLLREDLQEIITIDSNPLQNALFNLKKTALAHLSNAEYLAFLGIHPHINRLETYRKLESKLSAPSPAIWSRHLDKISAGVVYEGTLERLLKRCSNVIRSFRGGKIDRLFRCDDLEEQRQFLEREWHSYLWKKTFELALHPLITRFFIRDPGLYEYVDPSIHVGNYLHNRLHSSLNRCLAKESILISLIFKGSVDTKYLPPYLSEKELEVIRPRLNRIQSKTCDLISFLEKSPPNYFDCFSTSDVASYLSKEDFHRMIQVIYNAAKPGARFCMRQFLSNHQIPPAFKHSFKRNPELEKQLEKEDRCFVYRFLVGTIQK